MDIEEEKIKELDKRVMEKYNLVFKYKGKTKDEDFNNYDNALVLMQKIKRSETSLSKALKEQKEFKDRMEEIKKVQKKHLLPESKTVKLEKLLLIFIIILLKEHLNLDIKQDKKQKDLKY